MESTGSPQVSPVKRLHSNILGRILLSTPSARLNVPNQESGRISKKLSSTIIVYEDSVPNDALVRLLRCFGDAVQQAANLFVSLENSLRQTQSSIDRLRIRTEILAESIQRGDPKRHCKPILLFQTIRSDALLNLLTSKLLIVNKFYLSIFTHFTACK